MPDYSYYLMGIIATILIVVNYAISEDANDVFWTILSFSMLIFLIPYAFVFPAYLKLHYFDKQVKRAYKVPGGAIGAWICAILCFVFIVAAIFLLFFDDTQPTIYFVTLFGGTAITTVIGYLLYLSGKKIEKTN